MGTIASLLGQIGESQPRPWDQAQRSVTEAQTGLITLADLKAKQRAEQEFLLSVQNDPRVREALLSGSLLGSLQQPQAPPGAAPMTQQTLMPGQPPGVPQTVPGGQDLSRFAGVSPQGGGPLPAGVGRPTGTPPQSTIGSLGPAGQPQMQAPQNPLLEMAARDPRAAMMMQQQIQGQQQHQFKLQEQQLDWQAKKMAYFGQVLQGVNSPESYGQAVQEIGRVDPQAAARLPKTYSKEGIQPFIDQAVNAKDTMLQRLESRKLDVLLRGQDVELAKAQQAGGKVNYQTDANGNIVVVPEYAPGGGPVQSRPVLGADGQPIKSLEGQKLTTEQQTQMRATETGLRTQLQARLAPFYETRDAIGRIEKSAESPSASGDLALITAFMKMLDPTTGVRDVEFKNAATAGGFLEQIKATIGRVESGERLSDTMRADLLKRSRMLFEQYGKDYGQVRQQFRDLTSRMGGNPENVDLEMGSTVAKPPGGGSAQGGNTFTDADIAATLANPANKGKTRQQVIDAALAKGLKYKER